MKIKRTCTKCKNENVITEMDIININTYDDLNNHYKIMCYRCKYCGKLIPVQADTKYTMRIANKVIKLMTRVIHLKEKGHKPNDKDRRENEKLNRKLDEERAIIYNCIKGAKLYDEDGKVLFENFEI